MKYIIRSNVWKEDLKTGELLYFDKGIPVMLVDGEELMVFGIVVEFADELLNQLNKLNSKGQYEFLGKKQKENSQTFL